MPLYGKPSGRGLVGGIYCRCADGGATPSQLKFAKCEVRVGAGRVVVSVGGLVLCCTLLGQGRGGLLWRPARAWGGTSHILGDEAARVHHWKSGHTTAQRMLAGSSPL